MSEYITLDFEPGDQPNMVVVQTNQNLAPDGAEVYQDITSGEEGSPLAQMLFAIDGVLALTLDGGTMIIRHTPECQLFTLIDEVRAVLTDFFLQRGATHRPALRTHQRDHSLTERCWMLVRRTAALLLILAVILIACGGSNEPPPDPITLIDEAAGYIQTAESFAVSIERSGAPVYIDTTGLINFLRATGWYVAPDRVQARVRVLVSGIAGDIDVIAIGTDQYYRHSILTGGQWLNAEFSPGFNAENLVRSESGLARAMSALQNVEMVGQEDVDGIGMWHITGTAVGSEVAALTIGLIPAQDDVLVDLYIRADDHHAERMRLVQPDTVSDTEPVPSTWLVEVYDYNGDYAVEVPGAASTGS